MSGRPIRFLAAAALAAALLVALVASAQSSDETQEDPAVNESDFDTTPPPADESYLDEAEAEYANETDANATDGGSSAPADGGDAPPADEDGGADATGTAGADGSADDGATTGDEPTLSASDFDMSAPSPDESYLDDAEREYARELAVDSPSSDKARTPGSGLALVALAAVGGALLLARRR